MSAFYDQASLVVVPSGYKSGKIYAQKPLTTDGQLTFTRASTATRVNASGLIETVSSGVPRLDYLNSSCPRLLLEPAATALNQFSEQLDNAYWTASAATITANAATAPDGYNGADNFVPTAASANNHRIYRPATSSVQTATYSIFIKPNGHNFYALRESSTTGSSIGFNLATKAITVTYSTGGCTASNGKIEAYSNGWYRISGTFSFASATTQGFGLYAAAPTWTSGDVESVAWAGDGISGAYIWGANMTSTSYLQSYIPTLGTSVTRLADAASKTGISSLIGQTEGTLFIEFTKQSAEVSERYLAVGDGTTANRIMIIGGTGVSIRGFISTASVVQFDFSAGTAVGTHKVALAYKANDVVMYIDGVQVTTDSSATIPAVANLYVGTHETGLNERLNGGVNQALLFKTRLTNAQLAELTSL